MTILVELLVDYLAINKKFIGDKNKIQIYRSMIGFDYRVRAI